MGNLAICASAVTTQPQAALRVAISVIFWAFVMPLIGLLIFGMMTVMPLILLTPFLLGLSGFFVLLYGAGFVPSVVTALFFQTIVRWTRPIIAVVATGVVSMLSATLWLAALSNERLAALLNDPPANIVDPSSDVYKALMAAAFGAALVMALSGLRARKRRELGSA